MYSDIKPLSNTRHVTVFSYYAVFSLCAVLNFDIVQFICFTFIVYVFEVMQWPPFIASLENPSGWGTGGEGLD